MITTAWVVGFLFDDERRENVLLVHKLRGPDGVKGHWNGVGGLVLPAESLNEAMDRTGGTEADVHPAWEGCFSLRIPNGPSPGIVWVYRAFDTLALRTAKTMTDETATVFNIQGDHFSRSRIVDNVAWMIPMLLDRRLDWTMCPMFRER